MVLTRSEPCLSPDLTKYGRTSRSGNKILFQNIYAHLTTFRYTGNSLDCTHVGRTLGVACAFGVVRILLFPYVLLRYGVKCLLRAKNTNLTRRLWFLLSRRQCLSACQVCFQT